MRRDKMSFVLKVEVISVYNYKSYLNESNTNLV